MREKRASLNKKSLGDLAAPHNFRPGSEEKIALLRERAGKGAPLFVPGEPHFYSSPETSLSGLFTSSLPSWKQGEKKAPETLPKQGRETNRSHSGVSSRRSLSTTKPVASAKKKAQPTVAEQKQPSVESWREESLVMPKRESIPEDVIKALEILAQSPNSAITGAEEMLAQLQTKKEESIPLPAISPAA